MLSFHALVIAAIFVPYLVLMTGLGIYITRTGRERQDEPPDPATEDGRPLPAGGVRLMTGIEDALAAFTAALPLTVTCPCLRLR